MAYLALDIGLELGWALQCSGDRVESGLKRLRQCGERDGVRFLALRHWLTETKARCDADGDPLGGLVYERVDFLAPRNGPYAAHVWGALWGITMMWAEHHAIPTKGLAVQTIKKVVTGHGSAAKSLVIKAIQKRWPDVTDDNQADALAVLLTAQEKLG